MEFTIVKPGKEFVYYTCDVCNAEFQCKAESLLQRKYSGVYHLEAICPNCGNSTYPTRSELALVL